MSKSDSQSFTIPVFVRTQDNGDGGYGIHVYNSLEELVQDHRLVKDENLSAADLERITKEIVDEDDPYENGYISEEQIEIVIENGVPRLKDKVHFHAGQ